MKSDLSHIVLRECPECFVCQSSLFVVLFAPEATYKMRIGKRRPVKALYDAMYRHFRAVSDMAVERIKELV